MASMGFWCTISRTIAVPHSVFAATLITGVALLFPRVAVRVVAVLLPEPELVVVEQRQPGHPLRRLPEVQRWYEQTYRPAVLWRQRLSFVFPSDPGLAVLQLLERQVGGVAGGRRRENVCGGRQRLRPVEQLVDADPGEVGAQLGPRGDAVDVAL